MATITLLAEELDHQPRFVFFDTSQHLDTLAQTVNIDSTAFQSVLVSAIQILDLVYEKECRIADAAISRAQKINLNTMIARIQAVRFASRSMLNMQGAKILQLQNNETYIEDSSVSWWYHVTEGIETLERGIDWICSIISGQPAGSPARKLSNVIAGLLRAHYDELLKEAENWLTV